jgi:hypothetical protein
MGRSPSPYPGDYAGSSVCQEGLEFPAAAHSFVLGCWRCLCIWGIPTSAALAFQQIPDSSSPVTASVPTSLSRAWIFVFLAQRTSTTTSGQRPDNCGNANRSIKPLATHGRAIHLGHWRRWPCVHAPSGYAPKLTRSAVFLTANLASTRRRPRARALVPSQPGARCRCRARRRANHRQLR